MKTFIAITLLILTAFLVSAQFQPQPTLNTNFPTVQLTVQAPDLIFADGYQVADVQSVVNWVNTQNFLTYGALGNYLSASNILFQTGATNPSSTMLFAPDGNGGLTVVPVPTINSSNIAVTPYSITFTTNYPTLISSYTFTATNTSARRIIARFSITTGSVVPSTPTNYFVVGFPAWSTAAASAELTAYGTNIAITTGTGLRIVPWLTTSNTVPVYNGPSALTANTLYQGTIGIDLW